jgi:hypothetical protein
LNELQALEFLVGLSKIVDISMGQNLGALAGDNGYTIALVNKIELVLAGNPLRINEVHKTCQLQYPTHYLIEYCSKSARSI